MTDTTLQLPRSPIVESVVDICCDMGSNLRLEDLESIAREAFRETYPEFQQQIVEEHRLETKEDGMPLVSARRGLSALQFLHADKKQLVQIRAQGFSFNRLAPYTSLDDYLPEIERTWRTFVELAKPVQIQQVRLRYINRLLLPLTDGQLEFTDFLKISPRLPDEDKLQFLGFLNQHAAVETETGNQVNIITTMQPPEADRLPVIFDIEVRHVGPAEIADWAWIRSNIDSLRLLKNRIFKNTLTEKCLSLF